MSNDDSHNPSVTRLEIPILREVGLIKSSAELVEKAKRDGVELEYDRLEAQGIQCGFGLMGLCCRNCYMGPCRIDPFGDGPSKGVCGATADTLVARNLLREEVGGAASHIEHAFEVAHVLLEVAEGKNKYYKISGEDKLMMLAGRLGIDTEGKSIEEVAKEVAEKALEDFTRINGEPLNWLKARASKIVYEKLVRMGLAPSNPLQDIMNAMHRSTMGNDADPINLLLACLRQGLIDGFSGLYLATDLQDVLFGVPRPRITKTSLGVISPDHVNIAVHGHNPILSMKIVEWAEKLEDEARKVGAKGINVVGICCTGNEVLERLGIPAAGNNAQAELAIVTGALEAMVVDIQCIFPSLAQICACYHTKLITTMPYAKIPGATHIEFDPGRADEIAREIVMEAIKNYRNRDPTKVHIPDYTREAMVGFSVEAIIDVLRKVNEEDPLKPLIDVIAEGKVKGAVGIVGCPNPKLRKYRITERLASGLLKRDILVVATGCTALAMAQEGMMTPDATEKYAGDGLREVLNVLGEAAGLDGPLPPVWHMGSCVDNSRIADLIFALSDRLNVDVSKLPVAGSAPEFITEKAISIGTFFLAIGVPVHIAPAARILGSPVVTEVLTDKLKEITGGHVIIEYDPERAAEKLYDVIMERRASLGLG